MAIELGITNTNFLFGRAGHSSLSIYLMQIGVYTIVFYIESDIHARYCLLNYETRRLIYKYPPSIKTVLSRHLRTVPILNHIITLTFHSCRVATIIGNSLNLDNCCSSARACSAVCGT